MNNFDIRRFQRVLESRHKEVVRSLDRLTDETRTVDFEGPKDVGDLCLTNMSKENLFQQADEQRALARTISEALGRIQRGTFGICVVCGEEINRRRLEALPWTRYCLGCQEGFEQEEELGSGLAGHQMAWRKAG